MLVGANAGDLGDGGPQKLKIFRKIYAQNLVKSNEEF